MIEGVCKDREKYSVYVAEVDETVVGFTAIVLNAEDLTGEIYLLAVDPGYQNCGIGTELNNFALGKMVEGGMKLAHVGTAGIQRTHPLDEPMRKPVSHHWRTSITTRACHSARASGRAISGVGSCKGER